MTTTSNPQYTRDLRIDILKFIGIMCIILAHVDPPNTLAQIRTFDVVLMVMLTGTSFYLSSNKKVNYWKHVTKRFRRLVVPTWIRELYDSFVLELIGWAIVVAIGVRLKNLQTKDLFICAGILSIVFVWCMIQYDFAPINNFKYPPQLYYISYGLLVSFLLLLLLNNKTICLALNNKVIVYITKNSFWLYLWHIIPVYIIKFFGKSMPWVTYNFITKYIFVIAIAFLLTAIQNWTNKKLTFT